MTLTMNIDNAIYEASCFLQSKQSRDGLWRDFETLAGSSSEWVSGFVLRALSYSECPSEVIFPCLTSLVFRQRPNGGWSYNHAVPTDCDSTAWVLMALSIAHNWRPSAIKRGIRYLERHQDEDFGGFSTYCPIDGIHKFIKAPAMDLMKGWFSPHKCVTSVSIQSLAENNYPVSSKLIHHALQYLQLQRNKRGYWDSYWWKGYAYSTYHALRALSICRSISASDFKDTIQFLLSSQRPDSGWNNSLNNSTEPSYDSEVFETAFMILSLLLYPTKETLSSAERAINWLIDQQDKNGSWPTVPILKIPPPVIIDPNTITKWRVNQMGTEVLLEDKERIFTTSAALWALSLFRSMV